jgi:CHAT domain-containing protein
MTCAPARLLVFVVSAAALGVGTITHAAVVEPVDPRARLEEQQGDTALERNELSAAIAHFNAALALAEQRGEPAAVSRLFTRLATAYFDQGEWARSLAYADRAAETAPAGDGRARAAALLQRGRALINLSDRAGAERALTEARALADRLGDTGLAGNIHQQLGLLIWRFQHDRAAALHEYDTAMAHARRAGSAILLANVLNSSGNIFRSNVVRSGNDLPEALRRYEQALDVVRRAHVSVIVPNLLKNIGEVRRQMGDRKGAERALVEAAAASDASNEGLVRWQARQALARLLLDDDPARAEAYFAECLDVLEAQHQGVLLEDFRAGGVAFAANLSGNPYDEYIEFLLARNEPARAFVVAERARARAFLDTLSQAREQIAETLPPALVAEERRLLEQISSRQGSLRAPELSADARRALIADAASDEERLTALRVRLAADHGALALARYPHLWTVEELQHQLIGRDEALVSFFIGVGHTTAWVVRHDQLSMVTLPGADAIDSAVRPLLAALRDPASDVRAMATSIEQALIPVVASLPSTVKRLILVPYGILSYLPFEVLADTRGTLLVERYAISYAPSASSYAYLRRQPTPSGDRVVAIGNPVMQSAGAAEQRGVPIDRVAWLKPLLYAGEELHVIARLFPGATSTLEGPAATEVALASPDVSRAAILHVATHGIIDEEHPERSALALTPVPPSSDGILQMREVYRLALHATLVTLSACQTALGKDVTGEGLMGLSRAFFYAGANAVMASLWDVNDRSTARFMTSFYGALAAGAPIDESARQAKRAMIAGDPRFRHPYYWAPFIVTGNAAVPIHVAITSPWRRALPFAGLVFAAALGGFVTWRRVSVGST